MVVTALVVAVKLALVAPAAIVTDAGTVTALLLLARLTAVALVAAEVSVAVHASVPAPVSDPLLQERALNTGVTGACPVPLRLIVCVVELAFRFVSVSTSEPLRLPALVGRKLMGRMHCSPAVSVASEEDVLVTSGQAVEAELESEKFDEMLGLSPVPGIRRLRGALPLLAIVTVFGLSELVEPTFVDRKLNEGGALRGSSFTKLWLSSATKTSPLPSTATP